ncbi:MAG TPA: baseplate J/gp47 family protein [Stellaceae bacterium]|nr:baseplate J/gp47 family protein [Stellaceae bacterium]
MPFNRPSLSDLRTQARASFAGRLQGADATLRRSAITVSADTMAGLVNGEYGYLDWMSQQLFPDTAESDYLDRWARIFGLTREAPTAASGNVLIQGTAGTPLPLNTLLQTTDGSVQVETIAAATLGNGATSVPAVATSTGAAANLAANAALTLVVAVANVQPNAAVDGNGFSGGADEESDASLRARVLLRIRKPPQGGDATDYQAWAALVNGVTRTWVFPRNRGPGTVDVTFVMDGRANILPLPADIANVQAAINANRPVTADSEVFALTGVPMNLAIANLMPNTASVQAAIEAALADLVGTFATPGAATIGPGVSASAPGGTLFLEQIESAIAGAAGVQTFDLTAPIADVTVPQGSITVLGTISFA